MVISAVKKATMSALACEVVAAFMGVGVWYSSCPAADRSLLFRHDLGMLEVDRNYDFTCEIVNTNTKEMNIASVKTSCGCLRAQSFAPQAIKPQGRWSVNMSFQSRGRFGLVQEQAGLYDSNGVQLATIIVAGRVRSVWVSQPELNFGRIQTNSPAPPALQAFILSAAIPDAKIESAKSDSGLLQVDIRDATTKDRSNIARGIDAIGHVSVAWKGRQASLGDFHDFVTVTTNVGQFKELKIPVRAFVVGAVSARPSTIVFGAVTPGGSIVRRSCTLRFENGSVPRGDSELRAFADHKEVSVDIDITNLVAQQTIDLAITFTPNEGRASIKGNISIKADEQIIAKLPYISVSKHAEPAGQ